MTLRLKLKQVFQFPRALHLHVAFFHTNTRIENKIQNNFSTWKCWNKSIFVYVKNSNIWDCSWLIWKINFLEDWPSIYGVVFVCISFCFVNKKIAHCWASINKTKNKNTLRHAVFRHTTGNIHVFFFFFLYFGLIHFWTYLC